MLSGIYQVAARATGLAKNATNVREMLSETLANVNDLIERKRCTELVYKFNFSVSLSRCAQLAIRR